MNLSVAPSSARRSKRRLATFNVFPALIRGEDSPSGSLTFQADTENVDGGVDISIVRRPAIAAFPTSYSKRAHTFRTAAGDDPATRARLGSPSFVSLNVNSPVPAGFIAELVAQHRPTRVQDGFRHLGSSEFGGADIADDDQSIFSCQFGADDVKLVAARVGNPRMDCTDAAFVAGALLDGERGLVFAVVAKGRNSHSIAARRQRLQTQVDTDRTFGNGQVVSHLTLERYIPAATSILREVARFEAIDGDIPRFPEAELALQVGQVGVINTHGARDERDPTKRTLWAEASSETWATLMLIAGVRELPADNLNGIGVQTKIRCAAGAKLNEIEGAQPANGEARAVSPLGLTLGRGTKVPDLIASNCMSGEVLAGRRVLDTIFECQNGHFVRVLYHKIRANAKGLFRSASMQQEAV